MSKAQSRKVPVYYITGKSVFTRVGDFLSEAVSSADADAVHTYIQKSISREIFKKSAEEISIVARKNKNIPLGFSIKAMPDKKAMEKFVENCPDYTVHMAEKQKALPDIVYQRPSSKLEEPPRF